VAADAHRLGRQGRRGLSRGDDRGETRRPLGHDDGHAFLLLRRHHHTGTISYYLCWSPRPVPLVWLIAVAVARVEIEENFQADKGLASLDEHQVRRWAS